MRSNSYLNNERKELLRSRLSHQESEAAKIRYKVRPKDGVSPEDVALSFLMVLTLRSKRYPRSSSRARMVEISGHIAELDRGAHTFWLVLNPPEGGRFVDISTVLNFALSPVEYDFASDVWIDQVILPDSLEKSLGGPKLGIKKMRERFFPRNDSRPLLGFTISNMLTDWTETKANIQGAIRGGVDFLADDILQPMGSDLASCLRRLKIVQDAMKLEKKPDLPYFANLCSYSLMNEEIIEPLLGAGVAGFVVNPFVTGWDHANSFRKTVGDRAAVFHTNMGSGITSRYASTVATSDATSGMAEGITSYLSRVSGADGVHAGTVDTACFDKDWQRPIEVLWEKHDTLLQSFRIAEGDITPNNLYANMLSLGTDLLVEANSAIYGHPDGAEKGASAFRELIDTIDPDWQEDQGVVMETRVLPKASRNLRKALEAFEKGGE